MDAEGPKMQRLAADFASDDAHLACVAPAPAAQSVDPTAKHDIDVADHVSSALSEHSESADFAEAADAASDDEHLAGVALALPCRRRRSECIADGARFCVM